MNIKAVLARQILDSRGNPTVEAEVWLESGTFGRSAVPSGASTGSHEAHELRDGGDAYQGQGVSKAVNNISEHISPKLKGQRADDQTKIDEIMINLDGTDQKTNLGANAILAVSLACAHAAANSMQIPLHKHISDLSSTHNPSIPMPMINLLNGGMHAQGSADIQENMIIPIGANSFAEALQISAEVFGALKQLIKNKGWATTVGDEGGFAPPASKGNSVMLDLLVNAIQKAGYEISKDIVFALDIAASELYRDSLYHLPADKRSMTSDQMISWYKELSTKYPIVSIEDGLAEDDWDGWQRLTKKLPKMQVVGDDLLVTNSKRLQRAIGERSANSILIKPNQIGTLSETLETIKLALSNGFRAIVSHRSGETEDTTIAHLAVGTGCGQIKTGSLSRSERVAKYNELLRIEERSGLKLRSPFK